jgi:hypothetical protein
VNKKGLNIKQFWGLITMEEIPSGAFVCEYLGEVITKKKGDTRGTHFGHINDTEANKYTLGEEAIIDFLIMSRCDYSLCMRSNLSLLNILLRTDFNYCFIDDHIQYDRLG